MTVQPEPVDPPKWSSLFGIDTSFRSDSEPVQSHCDAATIMFAEAEPLLRERRRVRRRLAALRDLREERERADEPGYNWYSTPSGVEYSRLNNHSDVLDGDLSDLFFAAYGHALLAIAEAQR